MFNNPFPVPFSVADILITSNPATLTQSYFYRVDHFLTSLNLQFTDYLFFITYNNLSWFAFNDTTLYNVPRHNDIVVLYRSNA